MESKFQRSQKIPSLIKEYFGHLAMMIILYGEGKEIDELELKDLLNDYGIENHFEIFKFLATWIPVYVKSWKIKKEDDFETIEGFNERIDLVNLSKKINKGEKIKWLEIKSNDGDKFRINDFMLIFDIGEIFKKKFYEDIIGMGYPKEKYYWEKLMKPKGKPNSNLRLAWLTFKLQRFLNVHTNLKAWDRIISNEQARFIFEFFQFTHVLKPDSINVSDEEYIRTLLNNYKNKRDILDCLI